MKNYLVTPFVLISTLILGSQVEAAQAICAEKFPPALHQVIQKAFTELENSKTSPGMVVSIFHPSTGYIQNAYGWENLKKNIPMKSDRIFDIGSVMKNFRWMILHKLIEQGHLALNDEVNQHISIPVLPGRKISDLMLHSTGMVDVGQTGFFSDLMGGHFDKTYSYNEMFQFFSQATNPLDREPYTNGLTNNFAVGTDFRYSSFGPLIAGEIAFLKTGKSILDLIEELILEPNELRDTSFMFGAAAPQRLSQGYEGIEEGEWTETEIIPSTEGVSSGFGRAMYSSGCDLVHYTQFVFTEDSFLKTETLNTMTQRSNPIFGGAAKVGLGVFTYSQLWGENFWGHLGSNAGHGHSSGIAHRKSDRLSVVVNANVDPDYSDYSVQFKIIKAVGEYFKE